MKNIWIKAIDPAKRIIAMMAVGLLVLGGMKAFNYLLADDVSSMSRLMMHEFYDQNDMDVLIVGASHARLGCDVSLISEKTGKKVFNASTNSQEPDASLAVIKEAVSLYDLETVYLELSHTVANQAKQIEERRSLTNLYLLSDYLKPSVNKMTWLLNASSSEHYINSFFPARRYFERVMDYEYIGSVLDRKNTNAYKDYDYITVGTSRYMGNGFCSDEAYIEKSAFIRAEAYNEYNISDIPDDWKKAVLDIIEFCNENEIELIIFETKVSNFELAGEGNYDDYLDMFTALIEGKGVKYVDFNLISEEYMPYREENFIDPDHYSSNGAEAFSPLLAEYMMGGVPEGAFFDSVSERLKSEPAAYYGIAYEKVEDKTTGESTRTGNLKLVANHPEEIEFRIEFTPCDGETQRIQDFCDNLEFQLPAEQNGTIVVSYRFKENPADVTSVGEVIW